DPVKHLRELSGGTGFDDVFVFAPVKIVRGAKAVLKTIETDPSEKPVAVQLFGSSEDDVVKAAQQIQDRFDVIDINCGCPAWKVIKTGAGSELLKQPERIGSFVKKLVTNVNRPITVKIRIGIDDNTINAVQVAKIVEQAGAAAIAIHGRTQAQGYSGKANWDIIRQVKESVKIPVIGNGDVFTPEDFKKRLDESKVDAIMIARGAMGNPAIFKQINEYLATGKYNYYHPIEQFFEYLELAKKYDISFSTIKTQAMSFTKGLRGGAKMRGQLMDAKTMQEIETVLKAVSLTE
ncbi:MAG TPA: tRNA-dihydrouridine synthase, partial [Acidobacteriota bacterium]|nr:tRNA-dihydrouridine synthase [Acidobacteriota bacterium]